MEFRFFRRMKIAPGLTLNLSKLGPSLSFGPRGAKVTVGRRGVRRTVGIPGTGLFYTTTGGGSRRSRRGKGKGAARATSESAISQNDRLTMGFFRRLVTPKKEEHFVDGMRALVGGKKSAAMRHFEQSDGLADASFMAGTLTITDEVSATVNTDISGVLLALAEVHQHQHRWRDAVNCLKRLRSLHRNDIIVTLSLAELLVEDVGGKPACKPVARCRLDRLGVGEKVTQYKWVY